jgi:DNA-binding response OmpR family regulator
MDNQLPEQLTVLVSDPDTNAQQIIYESLHSRFHIYFAANLATTKELLIRHRPVILLLELVHPDGNGLSIIDYVHTNQNLQDTIIACITHQSSVKDKVTAFQRGADDYLVKPINPQLLAARMTLLLRLSRLSSWRNDNFLRPGN